MKVSSDRQSTSGSLREYGSSGAASADDVTLRPRRVWLILSVLVVLLVAGCGGDIDTESIDTESLAEEDLSGLLPDADTAGSVLGVTIDQVDEGFGFSDWFGQGFEHADTEVIEDLRGAPAYMSSYRVASESDGQNIPSASTRIQLALFETAGAAEAATEVLTGELEASNPPEFDVADLADAGQGVVFDADASATTWTILRWDSLLAAIVASHPPDTDPIESARSLAEEIKTNLSTINKGD